MVLKVDAFQQKLLEIVEQCALSSDGLAALVGRLDLHESARPASRALPGWELSQYVVADVPGRAQHQHLPCAVGGGWATLARQGTPGWMPGNRRRTSGRRPSGHRCRGTVWPLGFLRKRWPSEQV